MTIREILATTSIPMDKADEGGGAAADDGGGDDGGDDTGQDDGGGVQANSILDHITDDDLKKDESLGKFDSVDKLAKSYKELEKKLGSNANQEQAPEDPSEYQLPGLAEDAQFQPNEEFTEEFKQKAQELGLTPTQVKELYGWYVEGVGEKEVGQRQEQAQQFREQSEQQLKKEFGNAYDEKIKHAADAVKQFGGEDLQEVLDKTGLGDHPAIVKTFAEVGRNLAEDTVGGSAKGEFGRTPEQAQEQIKELRQDPTVWQQYIDKGKPGHNEAGEKMTALYRDAYPDG